LAIPKQIPAPALSHFKSCFDQKVHTFTRTQISITKEATIIQGDGSTQKEVEARVKQIRNLAADTEQEYEKEKLNERIARLSGGVAVIQVGVCACLYYAVLVGVCVCLCLCRCVGVGVGVGLCQCVCGWVGDAQD